MQAIRAEIKKWEKSFKAQNARDPTVDDIKAQPDIANKYRLYKRLSKQAAAAASQPSTPPKAPALLPSTSRVAETTAPLATFNPFSPVKGRDKKRADPISPLPNATRNPFFTPTKSTSKRILSTSPGEPSTSRQPDAPTSALSRARKRLRGEPVSPSPDKGKRLRILSHSKLPIPPLNPSNTAVGPIHTNIDKSGSTVIGDSPVKPPAGSKSFTTLFQESLPPLMLEPKKGEGAPVQAPKNIPIDKPVNALPSFDEELGWLKTNRAAKGKARQQPIRQKSQKATKAMEAPASAEEQKRELHVPLKRPLSDTEPDSADTHSRPEVPLAHTLPLLPPSPPPDEISVAPSTSKPRQKPKLSMNARKKSKINNTSGEDSSEEADGDVWPKFKVIDATSQRPRLAHQGDDSWDENLESDPDPIIADVFRSKGQGSPHGIHPLRGGSPITSDAEAKGRLEVDLPDKLRDVLDLDVSDTKARDRHEERMVESLIYNRRTIHYDSNKGGEIWGVGEDSHSTRIRWDGELEVKRDTDGDDDWEGDPVPWDVAEL